MIDKAPVWSAASTCLTLFSFGKRLDNGNSKNVAALRQAGTPGKGLWFPADRIRTCHQSLSERSGHRRAGCRRNAGCYRPNHTACLDLQILKRQPLGLSLLCGSKPLSSLTSEMQAPQRTHVSATQFGGGERNMTCDPTNRLKL